MKIHTFILYSQKYIFENFLYVTLIIKLMKRVKPVVFLTSFILNILGFQLFGQNDYLSFEDAIPIMDMEKNKVAANLYTGSLMVSVPIFTYKDKDFEMPISIEYISNGLKSEPIGHLGLGWNLNVGGCITRQIKGIPDEESGHSHYDPWRGYLNFSKQKSKSGEEGLFNNGKIIQALYGLGYPIYTWDISGFLYETTPDVFTFRFGDHTGSFSFGQSDTIYVYNTKYPSGEYKINAIIINGKIKFEIHTGDGYLYTFEEGSIPSSAMRIDRKPNFLYPDQDGPNTCWNLTSILAPNGRKITFEYGTVEYNANTKYYASSTEEWDDYIVPRKVSNGYAYGYLNTMDRIAPLKKIKSDNFSITFSYISRKKEKVEALPNTIEKYYQYIEIPTISLLHRIAVEDALEIEEMKSISFSYIYSDTVTQNSKVGFAEGGRPVLFLKRISLSQNENYFFEYCDENKSFPLLGQGVDHWGFFNGTIQRVHHQYTVTNSNFEESHGEIIEDDEPYYEAIPNFHIAKMGMLKKIQYPTGGYTGFIYEGNTYSSKVTKDLESQNLPYLKIYSDEKEAGGVRIKQIKNYYSETDSIIDKEFIYHKISDNNSHFSSGILLHTPRYFRKFSNLQTTPILPIPFSLHRKEYSPYGSFLHTEDKTHIGYSSVSVLTKEGFIEYCFSDYSLIPDIDNNQYSDKKIQTLNLISYSPDYIDNFFSKNISLHTQRGKLISERYYDTENHPVYSKEYQYDYNRQLPYQPYAELAYSYFYLTRMITGDYPLTEVIETYYQKNSANLTNKIKYFYNPRGQIVNEEIVNQGKTISHKYQYVNSSDLDPVHKKMLQKNLLKYPVKEQKSVSGQGIIEGKYNIYQEKENGFIFLSEEKSTEIRQPLSIPDFSFDSYLSTFNKYIYDNSGNIIQKTDYKGMNTVYVWGGIYLLAEIKNATIEQIKTVPGLTGIEDKLDFNKLTETLINALYSIKNTEIIIKEFKPLIGISKIMDPSGKIINYEYDDFDRLESVSDQDRKIIKYLQYHYRNQ